MSRSNEQKWPIPESVNEIENYMKQRVGLGVSFDFGCSEIKSSQKRRTYLLC